jgi:hypothetical protein
MGVRSRDYRALAAECLRLAATATDANSQAEYLALAQMWTELANETPVARGALDRAQEAFNDGQFGRGDEVANQPQQQQQDRPPKK